MVMEAQEEVVGSKDHTQIIKGKRTKRQRPPSPLRLTMTSSSTSAGEGGGRRVSDNSGGIDRPTASPTTSAEFTESTEDEDMANCLILLAQGCQSRKVQVPMAATTGKVGLYVYQCQTCNRCFPSFQALGGHRASHKKRKANIEEKKFKAMSLMADEDYHFNSTTLSLQMANKALCSNKKSKFHECSVCGVEFSSGQALGGHMRRHRTLTSPTTTMSLGTSSPEYHESKKPRNTLQLDLNLPAPEESKFSFKSKEQVLVFSASPLVDCHY